MILIFHRTGQRRYGIQVKRPPYPDVEKMPSAPGFDPLMPHDMMHLVVEAKLGLKHGIFGQLAAGGTAGTFYIPTTQVSTRKLSRARNHLRTRGQKLLQEGRDDCAQSERATYMCWHEWRSRSKVSSERLAAQSMTEQAKQVKGVARSAEQEKFNIRKLDEICVHLDELSSRWSQLKVGERMIVRWPDLRILDSETELEAGSALPRQIGVL
jgi:hypothetical protein